jgi:hypothetical protein
MQMSGFRGVQKYRESKTLSIPREFDFIAQSIELIFT